MAFFLVVPTVLATGKTGTIGDDLAARLFYLSLAWLAPLTFQFYRQVSGRPLGHPDRIVLGVLCGFALAWSLPLLFWQTPTWQDSSWFAIVRLGARLSFVVAFLLAAGWLFQDYRHRASAVVRRRIRLIAFGTICAFTPMLLLSVLPETLGVPIYVPYELTFLCLLLCPLVYGYALVRHELVKVEAIVSRTAMYFLVVTLILSIYLVADAVLNRFAVDLSNLRLLPIAVLSTMLLLLLSPLTRELRRFTDWVLYGSEINYTALLERLTDALSLTLDQDRLESLLMDQLQMQVHLSGTGLILRDREGQFTLVATRGLGNGDIDPLHVPHDGKLMALLEAAPQPLAALQVRQALAAAPLEREEELLLALPNVAFWVPLVAPKSLQGVLIVGTKIGGDFFTSEDHRLLMTLSRQAGIAANNVWLTEQVRAGQEELALAHQQLLVGREHEQRRLAREIHDGAVQELLAVINSLSRARRKLTAWRPPDAPQLDKVVSELDLTRRETQAVVNQLRGLIGELRPPGLDDLSVGAALEAYVTRVQREQTDTRLPHIELALDDPPTHMPEAVKICLFRVAQEALRNVLKHAQAHHVILSLQFLPDTVVLCVRDDGRGFRVPARLSELVRARHFGLVGMAERVASIGGQVAIRSQPETGTEIVVRVPLLPENLTA